MHEVPVAAGEQDPAAPHSSPHRAGGDDAADAVDAQWPLGHSGSDDAGAAGAALVGSRQTAPSRRSTEVGAAHSRSVAHAGGVRPSPPRLRALRSPSAALRREALPAVARRCGPRECTEAKRKATDAHRDQCCGRQSTSQAQMRLLHLPVRGFYRWLRIVSLLPHHGARRFIAAWPRAFDAHRDRCRAESSRKPPAARQLTRPASSSGSCWQQRTNLAHRAASQYLRAGSGGADEKEWNRDRGRPPRKIEARGGADLCARQAQRFSRSR